MSDLVKYQKIVKPKQPPRVWIFFTKEERQRIRQEDPDMDSTRVSKELSKRWRNLPSPEKKIYRRKYQEAKKIYDMKMVAYHEAMKKLKREYPIPRQRVITRMEKKRRGSTLTSINKKNKKRKPRRALIQRPVTSSSDEDETSDDSDSESSSKKSTSPMINSTPKRRKAIRSNTKPKSLVSSRKRPVSRGISKGLQSSSDESNESDESDSDRGTSQINNSNSMVGVSKRSKFRDLKQEEVHFSTNPIKKKSKKKNKKNRKNLSKKKKFKKKLKKHPKMKNHHSSSKISSDENSDSSDSDDIYSHQYYKDRRSSKNKRNKRKYRN